MDRTDALERLDAILPSDGGKDPLIVSVCVIAGTAGAGKTSLALRWAHQAKGWFPDGQLYVNLRGYDPGEPVAAHEALHRFLTALGTPAATIPADPDAAAALYRSMLSGRRMLVVLDNAATVAQVRPLLPGNSHCLVVVTSRGRLSGLSIRDGAERITLGTLPETEAVALLHAVTAGHRPADDSRNLAELAQLCARLPLALRIAAERAATHPHMGIDELIEDLRDESALWDALSTGDEVEADAVRTVFAWSYRALSADAARLFRLLGLHPGPEFGLAAATALSALPIRRTRQLLDVLVGAHLLEQTALDRYEFHDLLRAYAAEQAKAEEPPRARLAALRRLLDWYVYAADAAMTLLWPHHKRLGLGQPPPDVNVPGFVDYEQAVDWAEREQANVVAAVRVAEREGLDRYVSWLADLVWSARAPSAVIPDLLPVMEQGLRAARRSGDREAEARLLEALGLGNRMANRLSASREFLDAALTLRRELGDRRGEAAALNALGLLDARTRRLDAADGHFLRAGAVYREVDEGRLEIVALSNLAASRLQAGRLDEAARDARRALEFHREAGNKRSIGNALRILSALHLDRGEPLEALRTADEAIAIALELRNTTLEGYWLLARADALRALRRFGEALEAGQRSAVLHGRLGDTSRAAMGWHGVGETYQAMGRPADAEPFHRMAVEAHHALGETWHAAVALDGLARAVQEDHPAQAVAHWDEAIGLIAEYRDDRAVAFRDRMIRARQQASHGGV
ncbi:tetratricopeptide repeat protein [Streptomyces sp. NBRC 110028]|uniref:ATP-binding protein n=1 Tax=Streptomyces sp. NBRC 110028 TaxID=1621260 RepID=UPI001F324B67|nr:tetratricopeptide repeat protein [Streptomyces sp. NBRC 110028]